MLLHLLCWLSGAAACLARAPTPVFSVAKPPPKQSPNPPLAPAQSSINQPNPITQLLTTIITASDPRPQRREVPRGLPRQHPADDGAAGGVRARAAAEAAAAEARGRPRHDRGRPHPARARGALVARCGGAARVCLCSCVCVAVPQCAVVLCVRKLCCAAFFCPRPHTTLSSPSHIKNTKKQKSSTRTARPRAAVRPAVHDVVRGAARRQGADLPPARLGRRRARRPRAGRHLCRVRVVRRRDEARQARDQERHPVRRRPRVEARAHRQGALFFAALLVRGLASSKLAAHRMATATTATAARHPLQRPPPPPTKHKTNA